MSDPRIPDQPWEQSIAPTMCPVGGGPVFQALPKAVGRALHEALHRAVYVPTQEVVDDDVWGIVYEALAP